VLSAMSGRYLGPLLNRRTEPVDKAVITELFRRRQLMLLTVLAVPLAMFAELTLTLLFSSRFTAAGPWLPTFLVWQLVTLQVAIQVQLFFALDDLKPVATIAIAGNAVAIALCFAAVPRFGLTGAAAALLAGALLMNAAGAHRLRRHHGIASQRESRLLTTYVVLSLLIMPYLLRLLDPAGAAAALRIGVCTALVSGLWLFLDNGERHQLTSRLRRRAA
jgi:O-antigen/teichoic acid export membrane protein